MRSAAKIVSFLSLCAVGLPCVLLLTGAVNLVIVQWLAGLGTIGWFIATPIWMGDIPIVDSEPIL